MPNRVRRTAGAIAAALAISAATAHAVGALDVRDDGTVVTADGRAAGGHVRAAVTPSNALDLDSVSADASRSTVQILQLSVRGGSLSLVDPHRAVTFESVRGRHAVASIAPVRVIDARGSGAGWVVRWSVEAVTADGSDLPVGSVRVVPGQPAVVAGDPAGVTRGTDDGRLFQAAPGTGGGTYEAPSTVTVRIPRGVPARNVVVRLVFSVDPHG